MKRSASTDHVSDGGCAALHPRYVSFDLGLPLPSVARRLPLRDRPLVFTG